MKDNDHYKTVATKLSCEAYARMERLCKKKGLTIYEMIQMVCDTLIRYMDDKHNLTPEMEKAMSIFEHMTGWKNAYNIAAAGTTKEVGEAIYFCQAEGGGKHGTRAVLVEKPYFGMPTQTYNIQQMMERFICLTMPERYRRLRAMAAVADCSSILELMDHLVDTYSKDEDLKEYREGFEDNDRSDWGIKPLDEPYKRRHTRRMESLEDELGFRPHGNEW